MLHRGPEDAVSRCECVACVWLIHSLAKATFTNLLCKSVVHHPKRGLNSCSLLSVCLVHCCCLCLQSCFMICGLRSAWGGVVMSPVFLQAAVVAFPSTPSFLVIPEWPGTQHTVNSGFEAQADIMALKSIDKMVPTGLFGWSATYNTQGVCVENGLANMISDNVIHNDKKSPPCL